MVAFEPGINFIELIRRKREAINGILNERHGIHLPSKPIIGDGEMRNKKGGVRQVEIFIYITAAMLITIFINITAAGWLAIKMAEFMWEKVRRL